MRQFLKSLLATLLGLLIFSVVSVLVVIAFISVIAHSSSSKEPEQIKENSVLKITLNKPITERSKDNPFENIPGFQGQESSIGIIEIREALANAALDTKIKGIYLEMGYLQAGYASVEEIRDAIIEFKKSGKFVIAYGNYYSEKDYYLASVADQIFLNPSGILEFDGYSANYTFFKGAFDKLDVKPEIFRVGDYKSAVEPFFRESMSDASKLQTLSFLGSVQEHNWENIAKSRGISVSELKTIADSLLVREPVDAKKYKLITDIGYFDEVQAEIRKKLSLKKESDKINYIAVSKYLKSEKMIKESDSKNKIAVIIASGEISGDESTENETIGADLAETIRKARLDENIKAVVIRINSPGGSSLTSDILWREIVLTKKVKPIVASMSDVAASGGYYLAMGCDTIVAHPNTITGSIGIFALWFNIEPMLKNKLGITIDGVKTNSHSDIGSRPLDDFERNYIQKSVNNGYEEFTKKAAEGRKMNQDDLKKIASGRVWSGTEAKNNNLVDVYGGLEDAIKIAAKLSKIKDSDYKVKYLPERKDFAQEFFSKLSNDTEEKIFIKQYGELAPYVKKVKSLEKSKGIQAKMPFEIEIK